MAAICEHELEGVVCKRLNEPYLCGERSGVKAKNRSLDDFPSFDST